MPIEIVPPSPAPPPKPGFIRHQFILVLGAQDVKDAINKNPYAIEDLLMEYFGFAVLYAEKVMDGDFHGWHVYHDYSEGEFEKLMKDSEEKSWSFIKVRIRFRHVRFNLQAKIHGDLHSVYFSGIQRRGRKKFCRINYQ